MLFPRNARSSLAHNTGGRCFGANRSDGKRKHAGCDLIAPVDTAVRSVEDGEVKAFYCTSPARCTSCDPNPMRQDVASFGSNGFDAGRFNGSSAKAG